MALNRSLQKPSEPLLSAGTETALFVGESGWQQRTSENKNMDLQEKANTDNCPYCTKIIFKDASFNSEASFSMRCPHCNKNLKVIIKYKVDITILPAHEEHNTKKSSGIRAGI